MSASDNAELVSVVVPLYNEADVFETFYREVTEVLTEAPFRYELIFVDDGSTDGTWDLVESAAGSDEAVKGISLSRNFGHQLALTAGMDVAGGDCVITMDGDLQHPPDKVLEMVGKWREGYEIVSMLREDTGDAGLGKRVTSKLFYATLNFLSDEHIVPGAADFRLLDRRPLEALRQMGERTRFLRGLVSWIGYRSCSLTYAAPARARGRSKYSARRMCSLALDGILSFSTKPLRLATAMGLGVTAAGCAYGAYVLACRLWGHGLVPGWSSLLLCVLLMGGVQLTTVGILGEYIGKIYHEVKGRPPYLVARQAGVPTRENRRRTGGDRTPRDGGGNASQGEPSA